jgi:signal transduction histidine kinase
MSAIEAIGDEPEELRRTLRDLVALSMLPATWLKHDARQIAESVIEVLVRMLGLELACIVLRWDDRPEISVARTSDRAAPDRSAAIRDALTPAFDEPLPGGDVIRLANPVGAGFVHAVVKPVAAGQDSVIVAASRHPDFPTATQALLLGIAANQAAIAIRRWQAEQALQVLNETLEQRVVERTSQLMKASEALREAEAELARINRVTTMGQLAASIAHEVMQPITAGVTNARAALRWLGTQPPDLEEVRQALGRVVEEGNRAADVIDRIRALIKKAPPRKDGLEINETILEVIALTRGEVVRNGVSVRTQLAEGLPLIQGDRVQLQQVILNLIINAVEAMSGVSEALRELLIGTGKDASGGVLVAVQDSGPGLDWDRVDDLFEAFHTTKPDGIGMGLAISRSIVEAHGGQLWATPNAPRGAVFQFTLPLEAGEASSQHTQSAS